MSLATDKHILLQRVEEALNSIRPHLKSDGGDIEVIDITENNIVHVKLLGNCENCPMSFMTMQAGVEQSIKTSIPEINGVVAV